MHARITRELTNLRKGIDKGEYQGISFNMIDENPRHIKLMISGPRDTPYEGGNFEFRVFYDETYPVTPPHVKLNTKIYHPNIDGIGKICLNILKKENWSPVIQLSTLAMSLRGLLESPNTDDPLDITVNAKFKSDLEGAKKIAKEYTVKYAM